MKTQPTNCICLPEYFQQECNLDCDICSYNRGLPSELDAFRIMRKVHGWGIDPNDGRTLYDAGDFIINLAEQIKRERNE